MKSRIYTHYDPNPEKCFVWWLPAWEEVEGPRPRVWAKFTCAKVDLDPGFDPHRFKGSGYLVDGEGNPV